jgi:hypothetical protein
VFGATPQSLAAAADGLVAALPGDPARAPVDEWGRQRHIIPGAGAIVDLVRIAEAIDARLAERLVKHMLAWPGAYSLDDTVVPAVKRLLDGGAQRSGAAIERLLAACLAHLEARAAAPLEAPKDWSRDSNIRCTCEHCAALGRFLASPSTETWTLKAAEQVRGHVEGISRGRVPISTREQSSVAGPTA